MPRPRPNGISTAMIELRSRAFDPEDADQQRREQRPDDRAGDDVRSEQQRRGGAGERQLADAVHGEREVARSSRTTPIRPPTMPSTAPARIEFCTQDEQLAVVGEVEDLRPEVAAHQRGSASSSVLRVVDVVLVVVVHSVPPGRRATTMRPRLRMTSTGVSYRSAQHLGAQHLVGGADAEPAAGQVEHPVDHAEHRVDVVGDEQRRRCPAPGGCWSISSLDAALVVQVEREQRLVAEQQRAGRRRATGRPAGAAARRRRGCATGASA